MDVRQLRYLVALVQEQHFSRAAARCNISQPALSAQIRKLEDELGVPLIKRGNAYGGLTPEGERLIARARQLVGDADALVDAAAVLRGDLVGALRIGVVPSALPMVPRLTRPLAEQHPALRFDVRSMSSKEIQKGLDDLSLDAGITYLDNEPLNAVDMLGLYEEEFSLLVPSRAAASLPDPIAWSALDGVALCLLSPDMQNRRIVDAALSTVGLRPDPVIVSNSVVTLYSHVRETGLCTIVPRTHAHLLGLASDMELRRLVNPVVRQRIGLVRSETQLHAPRVSALWATAQSVKIADHDA
ncbi:MAG: LysR family transcriptional regulator [Pseudomonadota bacterium]